VAAGSILTSETDTGKRPWRFGGYSSEPLVNDSGAVYCSRPKVLLAGSVLTRKVACVRHCDPCRLRYRRQISATARLGLDLSTHPYAYMVTLTAPGKGTDLAAWNTDSGRCWNRMALLLRRFDLTIQYLRAAEVQQRGAIHHHVLILSSLPLTRNRVSRMAKRAGYGWMVDVQRITSTKAAAAYVAKYVAKAAGQRDEVPWLGDVVDDSTGVLQLGVVRARYRTWSRSRRYGITLAAVKAARYRAYCAARDNAILDEIQSHYGESVPPSPIPEASPP